jgi:hypothetical protein
MTICARDVVNDQLNAFFFSMWVHGSSIPNRFNCPLGGGTLIAFFKLHKKSILFFIIDVMFAQYIIKDDVTDQVSLLKSLV